VVVGRKGPLPEFNGNNTTFTSFYDRTVITVISAFEIVEGVMYSCDDITAFNSELID
jgi:hypothetical protein